MRWIGIFQILFTLTLANAGDFSSYSRKFILTRETEVISFSTRTCRINDKGDLMTCDVLATLPAGTMIIYTHRSHALVPDTTMGVLGFKGRWIAYEVVYLDKENTFQVGHVWSLD